jgi:hypothetical protein
MVTWEHRQAEALCRGQAITAITQTILNARQMTCLHVCITGNLRTAHGDLGAPGYDF